MEPGGSEGSSPEQGRGDGDSLSRESCPQQPCRARPVSCSPGHRAAAAISRPLISLSVSFQAPRHVVKAACSTAVPAGGSGGGRRIFHGRQRRNGTRGSGRARGARPAGKVSLRPPVPCPGSPSGGQVTIPGWSHPRVLRCDGSRASSVGNGAASPLLVLGVEVRERFGYGTGSNPGIGSREGTGSPAGRETRGIRQSPHSGTIPRGWKEGRGSLSCGNNLECAIHQPKLLRASQASGSGASISGAAQGRPGCGTRERSGNVKPCGWASSAPKGVGAGRTRIFSIAAFVGIVTKHRLFLSTAVKAQPWCSLAGRAVPHQSRQEFCRVCGAEGYRGEIEEPAELLAG